MAKGIREGKLLYHVTSIKNLESILKNGLLSREDVIAKGLNIVDVADPAILEKRDELGIAQYIPFHFFEPTAFTGSVIDSHSTENFCCITIKREYAKQRNFKICTAHPLSQNPEALVLDYVEGYQNINWEEAEKRDYNNPISKNACMAECLAVSPLRPEDFCIIFVANEEVKREVDEIITNILGKASISVLINEYLVKA